MNDKQIVDAFRDHVREEDISDSFFEFGYWLRTLAPPEAKRVVEPVGAISFYMEYLP